jgi:RNA polymerase sigma-70 factor (ECF subfamily)
MPLPGPFEGVLLAARAGEEWAWAQLYASLAPAVTSYARGHGAREPEDVTGEVFLHVVRGLERFSGGEHELRAWVLTIAHRRVVDDLRRRGRRPADPAEPGTVERAAGADPDPRADPEAAAADSAVRAALAALPVDQRSVMLLRIFGDMTIEEIARAVGKRPGAVKALQRRAIRRLAGAYPFAPPRR